MPDCVLFFEEQFLVFFFRFVSNVMYKVCACMSINAPTPEFIKNESTINNQQKADMC
ncbi:hypothetical protein JCM21142_72647 [Saccharicrinis fermentans DSM 9555 = JCM 21142]|uniref:Uncharacterized protein n=1 Tax=Saccharicrinis fermentans DSM 9555 = JCM 21142 TaxID=869213 RepID=W7Y6S7_9BACT|nr:hypothetical protein JCM21142_72647 [Saccharicrinis fermentans DSM 9555 = JCM 21142]